MLGAAGTGSPMPSIPAPDHTEAAGNQEDTADPEEEQMRNTLQNVPRSCANSLGISPEVAAHQTEVKSDAKQPKKGREP